MNTEGARLPFDVILVEDENGSRQLSIAQLMDMPLAERVRLILLRKLEFLSNGKPIDRKVGLKSLTEVLNNRRGNGGQ